MNGNGAESVDELLARAYALDGPDANRELYADWASTYDETFVARSAYVYHRNVAGLFAAGFGGGRVLDVGCGTGVVGVALQELGVDDIDGIDISAEMLAEAGRKHVDGRPVYRELIEADLTGPIDLPADRYAGVVSAGTFTHGHLGPESLDELIRVAAPGARCAIGINAAHFEELGFRSFLTARRDAGVITSLDLTIAPVYADAEAENADHFTQVAVFQVS